MKCKKNVTDTKDHMRYEICIVHEVNMIFTDLLCSSYPSSLSSTKLKAPLLYVNRFLSDLVHIFFC